MFVSCWEMEVQKKGGVSETKEKEKGSETIRRYSVMEKSEDHEHAQFRFSPIAEFREIVGNRSVHSHEAFAIFSHLPNTSKDNNLRVPVSL